MKTIKFLVVCGVMISLISCNNQGVTKKSLNSELDSVSYALGLDMGIKVKSNFSDIEKELFIQGFHNAIDSSNMLIEGQNVNAILNKFFQKRQQEAMAKKREEAANKAEVDFDEVKKEVLVLKGQLEETAHLNRLLREQNKELEASFQLYSKKVELAHGI